MKIARTWIEWEIVMKNFACFQNQKKRDLCQKKAETWIEMAKCYK